MRGSLIIWELLLHDPNTDHQMSVIMFTNPVVIGPVSKIKLHETAMEIKSLTHCYIINVLTVRLFFNANYSGKVSIFI